MHIASESTRNRKKLTTFNYKNEKKFPKKNEEKDKKYLTNEIRFFKFKICSRLEVVQRLFCLLEKSQMDFVLSNFDEKFTRKNKKLEFREKLFLKLEKNYFIIEV